MTKRWREPLVCRMFGHRWKATGVTAIVFISEADVERCSRCGSGRVMTVMGPRYYEPKAVTEFIARVAAVTESPNVVAFQKGDGHA